MDNLDRLHQIKEMLRSEGWAEVQALWDRFLTRKEQEKASHLRKDEYSKAVYNQGKIDGVKELLIGTNSDLDKHLATLAKETKDEQPAY